MRRALLGLTLLIATLVGSGAGQARPAGGPVVVELYTAQGCEGCPDANAVIGRLAARRDLLPLTFSVDYWDYLGWRDTFAAPEFTERQRAFVRRLKAGDLYTPQVVVDGRAEAPGVDPQRVDRLIRQGVAARAGASGPRITTTRRGARVRVSPGGAVRSADVWMVRYDPRPQAVKVRGDDRKTRTVTVHNTVRELVRLGIWRGRSRSYALPAARSEGLSTAVLVQGRDGGRILAAWRN